MRMCAIQNCSSNSSQLNKWMEKTCSVHDCKHLTRTCICPPPFILIPFPTERRDNEGRMRWTEIVRKNHNCGNRWQPNGRRNSRICSKHFVGGEPSPLHPDPTLLLSLPPTKRKRPLIPLPRIPSEAHQAWMSKCSGREDCLCVGCIRKRNDTRNPPDEVDSLKKVQVVFKGGRQTNQTKPKDKKCENKYIKVEGEEDCFEIEEEVESLLHQDESEENASYSKEQQLDKDDEQYCIRVAGDQGCYVIEEQEMTSHHGGPDKDEAYTEEDQLPMDSVEEEVAGHDIDDDDADCSSNTYQNLIFKLQSSESKASDKMRLICEKTFVGRREDHRKEGHSLIRESVEGGSRTLCDLSVDQRFEPQGSLDKNGAIHADVIQDLGRIGDLSKGGQSLLRKRMEHGSHTEGWCEVSGDLGLSDSDMTKSMLSNGATFTDEPDHKSLVIKEEDYVGSSDESSSVSSSNTEPYPLFEHEEELVRNPCLTPDMPTCIFTGDTLYQCRECQLGFALENDLTAHMVIHNRAKQYQCGVCNEGFSNVLGLTSHIKIHDVEMLYPCSICDVEFSNEDMLTRHMRIHNKEEPYRCSQCNIGFAFKLDLTAHMTAHTGEKTLECPECGKRFLYKKHLGKHIKKCHGCDGTKHFRMHIGGKPYQCDVCSIGFSQSSELTRHIIKIHGGEMPYQCSQCNIGFAHKLDLTVHMRTHTEEKTYECPHCDKGFNRKYGLTRHIRKHCPTIRKPHPCPECKMAFAESYKLICHMTIHTREKPFQCLECHKEFVIEAHLTAHMRTHTGERTYPCSKCNKAFNQEAQLIEHMRIHSRERHYHCLICNNKFVRKSHLTRHMGRHTGKKPHRCPECNVAFIQRSHLIDHMRRHTGEKPHQCPECDMEFITRSQLTRHVRIHTGEKPYECSQCHNRFSQRNVYLNHLKSHRKTKPFQCSECDKEFSMESQLTKHLSAHSKIQGCESSAF